MHFSHKIDHFQSVYFEGFLYVYSLAICQNLYSKRWLNRFQSLKLKDFPGVYETKWSNMHKMSITCRICFVHFFVSFIESEISFGTNCLKWFQLTQLSGSISISSHRCVLLSLSYWWRDYIGLVSKRSCSVYSLTPCYYLLN